MLDVAMIGRRAKQVALIAALLLVANVASAQSTIRDPHPPRYHLEIEPKLNIAYLFWNGYGGNAWGPGVRFSIPVMSPGFVRTINDSIAISFGLDAMHYAGYTNYGYYAYCAGNPKNCPGSTRKSIASTAVKLPKRRVSLSTWIITPPAALRPTLMLPSPPLRGRGAGGEGGRSAAPHPRPLSPE